jgi:hypothetical protein
VVDPDSSRCPPPERAYSVSEMSSPKLPPDEIVERPEPAGTGPGKRCRILTIDGGGLRGIIPAMMLAEIEERTGKPASALFDLIAGTSTGGLIALALAKPAPMTATEIVQFYQRDGPTIFRRRLLKSVQQLVRSAYSPKGLEAALLATFDDDRLSETNPPVVVMSYELQSRIPWFFKTLRAQKEPSYDFLLRDIARATSAAPTYFPPERLPIQGGQPFSVGQFIDGGVYANNPGVCGFVEASKLKKGLGGLPRTVVSLGTSLSAQPGPTRAMGWGILHWLNPRQQEPLLNAMLDGMSKTVKHQLKHLCDPVTTPHRCFRFDPEPRGVSVAVDDPLLRPKLEAMTRSYLACPEVDHKLNAMVPFLA